MRWSNLLRHLANYLLGTADQIDITDNGDGTTTVSLPDPIRAPGEVILLHDTFLQGRNAADTGDVDLLKVNVANEAEPGANVRVSGIELDADPGDVCLVDAAVSATPTAGDSQSYALRIDGQNILLIAAEADGAGGIQHAATWSYGRDVRVPSAATDYAVGDAINSSTRISRVQATTAGGALTLTSTPSIGAGKDGQVLIIQGQSDADTLTIQDESNLVGSGFAGDANADVTLGANDTVTVLFDLLTSKWIELSRSNT